jgi:hypothetical protein
MKKHLKAPLIVLVMVSVVGCGSRVEVAKEKALAKIDSLLGTMEVKRKEIDISVRALNDGINGLRKAKIKAQVKHDQLEQKVIPISDKIASVDQSLKKLRDHLASGEPVDIAGKTYSPQELKQMAGSCSQCPQGLRGPARRAEGSGAKSPKSCFNAGTQTAGIRATFVPARRPDR